MKLTLHRLVCAYSVFGIFGLLFITGSLAGCTLANSSDLTRREPVIAPSFVDKEHQVDTNNGFRLVNWTEHEEGNTCDIDTAGVFGTAKISTSGTYDWIWVTTNAEAPPNDGDSCFLRLTDDQNRITDLPMVQSTDLAPASTESKRPSAAPARGFLFVAPSQWSTSDHVKAELFVTKELLASWEVKNLDYTPATTNPQTHQQLEVAKIPADLGVEAIYRGMPSGRIESATRVVFTPKDTPDNPHRWVVVINSPEEAKGVFTGRGSVPISDLLTKPIDKQRDIHVQGAAYAFELALDLAEVPACSMKVVDDHYEFHSPFSMTANLPRKGGHVKIPACSVVATQGKDPDELLFEIPIHWASKADKDLSPDAEIGSHYRGIFATSRGHLVNVPSGQEDTFTLAMSRKEADNLIGGGFNWFVTFETRTLAGVQRIDSQLAVGESPIFTLSSALERSDGLIIAGVATPQTSDP